MAAILDPASPVQSGEIVSGRYLIDRVLGSGGMGVVVKATHLTLDRHVALKFMRTDLFEHEEEAKSRFLREARAIAKLHSDHVARVLDVGTLDGGEIYLALEYLEGADLGKRVRDLGALAPEQAVLFVLMTCHAIAEAHMNGIVHRDLKAENVFLVDAADGSASIKVLDFGISKVAEKNQAEASITNSNGSPFIGSPLTMSPEQMTAPLDVDARADVWGLGTLLFHLLTGRDAFDAPTASAVCAKVLHDATPSLCALRPELAPALEAVVWRCLEKKREERYQDVAELAAALSAFAPPQGATYPERIAALLGKTSGRADATDAIAGDVEPSAPEEAAPPPLAASPLIAPTGLKLGLKLAGAFVVAAALVVVLRDRARGGPISTTLGIAEAGSEARATPPAEPAPTTPPTGADEPVAPAPAASTAKPSPSPTAAPSTKPRARHPVRATPAPAAPRMQDDDYPGSEPPAALPPATPMTPDPPLAPAGNAPEPPAADPY